jgi:hypothetical protein
MTEWLRSKLRASPKAEPTRAEAQAAIAKQEERGEANLFDTVGKKFEQPRGPYIDASGKLKHLKTHTEVCGQ